MANDKRTHHSYTAAACLIITVTCVLIYANSAKAPFYVDDLVFSADDAHFHLADLTFSEIIRSGFQSIHSSRPIATITLNLNKYFSHGANTFGYHIVNIIIHLSTAIVLFLLLKNTLSLPKSCFFDKHPHLVAFFATLLWLTNPVQTEAVTYIVQRMTSMATLFYLLALLFYFYGRTATRWPPKLLLFVGCFLSWLIALGCKEIAITFPLILFLYEWYFFRATDLSWIRKRWYIIVLLLLAGLYEAMSKRYAIFKLYEQTPFTMAERLLTELRVLNYYIGLLLFPHPSRLQFYYDFTISKSLLSPPTTLLSLATLCSLFATAVACVRRYRMLSFAIVWYFINLFIESSFVGLALVFEHRLYLPSTLFFVPLAGFILRKEELTKRSVVLLTLVVCIFSFWTYQRNAVWADNIQFWQGNVDLAPEHPKVHNNLGFGLYQNGRYVEAIGHFKEALRLKEDYVDARFNLANTLNVLKRFSEAEKEYRILLRNYHPRAADMHNNLGIALLWQGKYMEASAEYDKALEIAPQHALALKNKRELLRRFGKSVEKQR